MRPLARVRSKTGRSPTQAGEGRAVNRRAMAAPSSLRMIGRAARGPIGVGPNRGCSGRVRRAGGSHDPGEFTTLGARSSGFPIALGDPIRPSRSGRSPGVASSSIEHRVIVADRRRVHALDSREVALARPGPMIDNDPSRRTQSRGGQGEPGGTRAMGACEPGQGGNAAAISIASMCPGAPPRLSPPLRRLAGDPTRGSEDLASQGPTERASCPDPEGPIPTRPSPIPSAIPWSPGAIGPSGSRTWSARTTSSRPSATRSA